MAAAASGRDRLAGDQLQGAGDDAAAAAAASFRLPVHGMLAVLDRFEGIEIFRTGGDAAAAAAAAPQSGEGRRLAGRCYLDFPHSGSSSCFQVVRRSSGSGEYCGQEAISADACCLHLRRQVLQRRFISASFIFFMAAAALIQFQIKSEIKAAKFKATKAYKLYVEEPKTSQRR